MTEIGLETYARLLAHVACRRGARVAQILSDLGIEADALRAAEANLREQLAGVLDQRKGVAAMKFAAALGAELQRLGPIGGDGAAPPPPEAVPLLADPPEVRETAMPSYLQAPSMAPLGGIVAPPFAPLMAPPLPTAAPALVLKEPRSASHLAGTAGVDLSAIVAAVEQGGLPFQRSLPSGGGAPDSPESKPSAAKRSPAVGTGTVDASMSAIVTADRSLPPFARPEAPGSRRAGAADEFDLSLLPLETYASVSTAIARGEPREAAIARHGLTPGAFDILAKAWGQRFLREPQLLERFKELARSGAGRAAGGDGQR